MPETISRLIGDFDVAAQDHALLGAADPKDITKIQRRYKLTKHKLTLAASLMSREIAGLKRIINRELQ